MALDPKVLPILPPQSAPPMDDGSNLFNKPIYLFLNGLIPAIIAASQSGGSSTGNLGWFVLTIASNAVTPDLGDALNQELTLNQATQVLVNDPVFTGGAITDGQEFNLYVLQDATGGRPTPAWGASFGADVTSQVISGDESTRSVFRLKFYDGLWHIDCVLVTGNL